MIDWNASRIAWNRDHKTNYKTRKEFLSALYDEFRACGKAAKAICVSHSSVSQAMKEDGTKLLPKGWRLPTPRQKLIIDLDTKNLTKKEIVEITGLDGNYCWVLLKKFKKTWKKLKN